MTQEQKVLDLVTTEIEKRQPRSFHLTVSPNGIRHEGDWWFIVVRPDKSGVRAFDYNNVLRSAELALERESNLNVLLVPVAVD